MERLAYHDIHGAERVKPGLEEINLILPRSNVTAHSNGLASAPVSIQIPHPVDI